ncbi:DUF723 domain-containing protein [Faustovirus]|nr:DUF723 domain-containing protein [Faustovirus]
MSLFENKELFHKLAALTIYEKNLELFGGILRGGKLIKKAMPNWSLCNYNIDADTILWWRCELYPDLEHHNHTMRIKDKINTLGKGCVNCQRYIRVEGTLSCEEGVKAHFDWEKNNMTPDQITRDMYKNKYYFRCIFGHPFETRATNFIGGVRCKQFCIQRVVIKWLNSLYVKTPDIEDHWDWEYNKIDPSRIAFASNEIFGFVCRKCNKPYTKMANEFSKGRRCPICNSQKAQPGRNTLDMDPDAVIWFDYIKNVKKICEYAVKGNERVWFRCPTCKHSFITTCSNFTDKKTRCKVCNPKHYSKACIDWLEMISKKYNIVIRHGKNIGEYRLPDIGLLIDGYVETNGNKIVFEFHGDFWHGYKGLKRQNEIHPKKHITFSKMYENTLEKERRIKEAGYTLIVIWESDYEIQRENFKNGNFNYSELE